MPQVNPKNPSTAQGTLLEQREGVIVLGLPGTEYQLHLRVSNPLPTPPNRPVSGRIVARAKRVDIVQTGGRFIEPVYGRPRRLQGAVIATDPGQNTITVDCGHCPFECVLTANQRAASFPIGALVSFDVEAGAVFETP